MALHAKPTYSAKCDDCDTLACGGCYDSDAARTIRCAVGCGFRQASDKKKKVWCSACAGKHCCVRCASYFENLNDDKKCEGCQE